MSFLAMENKNVFRKRTQTFFLDKVMKQSSQYLFLLTVKLSIGIYIAEISMKLLLLLPLFFHTIPNGSRN